MTEREKTAHVLRRFGLGAGRYELAQYESMGWRKALDAMVVGPASKSLFPVSAWQSFVKEDQKLEPYSYLVAGWWAMRMLLTDDPGQEKLSLFWHDHFAIDAEKVGEGAMMIGYLDVLDDHGRGKFRDLLHGVVKQGAVAFYLDGVTSNRIKPNENLARELLELFTVGIGKFKEEDVREVARSLTGWAMHYMGSYTNADYNVLLQTATKARMGVNNFAYVPALHDEGEKTILGVKKAWTGDETLDLLAQLPETAEHLCAKLWAYYGSPEPSPKATARMVETWRKTGGEIRAVLVTLGTSPEFWSPECVGQHYKSPVDFTVGLLRGTGAGVLARGLLGTIEESAPIRKELRDAGNAVHYLMGLQGLRLLYPPDVGGWDWGPAWLNASTTVARARHRDVLLSTEGDNPVGKIIIAQLVRDGFAESSERIVEGIADVFDARLDAAEKAVVREAVEAAGGASAFVDAQRGPRVLAAAAQVVFLTPSYQLM